MDWHPIQDVLPFLECIQNVFPMLDLEHHMLISTESNQIKF